MNEKDLQFFKEYKEVCSAYGLAQGTLSFDIATAAPKEGIPRRNALMSILAGEAFAYQTKKEHLDRLERMYEEAEEGSELKEELRQYFRLLENVCKLPKEVYIEQQQVIADSQFAWQQAKEANDYHIFQPHLENVIQMQKKVLTYLDKRCSDYDHLLDSYQQGTGIAMYDTFFTSVKEQLLPLINQIREKQDMIDDSLLFTSYDIEEQKAFVQEVLDYMQADRRKCTITTSEHPFTQFFSAQEARITTHYYENNLMSAILSTIHEYGHALYSLQVEERYDGTALKDGIGYAMHESQSRFMENHIGRSRAFWERNYPGLQKHFPKQLQAVSLDDFMRMINTSRPSLIRTEADELTYPIHILIRYELEKEIFNQSVDPSRLEALWNEKYEEYLGIRPVSPSTGILQDMHWGASYFGYFPTYALGSAYAAQFYHAMEQELAVDECLKRGDFQAISQWLRQHVHHYGACKTADEILLSATGEAFDPKYYIDYLRTKYTKLYQL